MSRAVRLSLLSLSLFLAAVPLVLEKPGLPPGLKADEAAYYLMALSLAHDHDLRLTPEDVTRAYQEFPFGEIDNLILMSDDGWRTVYFGKPYVYSLAAAPFAAVAGADGLLFFNLLLTLAMVWMGAVYLTRFNPDGFAALFAAGFTLASTGFAYATWLQPEVFNMAAVAAAVFGVFHFAGPEASGGGESAGAGAGEARRDEIGGRRLLAVAALSGAALALAAYNKPVFGVLGVALVFVLGRRPGGLRRWRWGVAGAWLAGFALVLGAVAGGSVLLTGHPTSYLGVNRMGVTLCEPGKMPIEPVPMEEAGPTAARPTAGAWSWIFHLPQVPLGELAENLGYFLWGRHTGLLLYFPFAGLAVLLFLIHGRRDPGRWLLLASLAAVALFFLLFIPQNWQGGGGFLGNRYYVNVVPAFLYLVTVVRPRALVPAGYLAAGLFLGPLLLSPFGRNVPEPTLQSHVRGWPYRFFPLELSLREVPGYDKRPVGGLSFLGRRDVFLPQGEAFWLRGAGTTEIWITAVEPLDRVVFQVESPAPDNRIALRVGDDEKVLDFPAPGIQRAELAPGGPDRVRRQAGGDVVNVYKLTVDAATGRVRQWTRRYPPADCPYFAANDSWEESFYAGAVLTYLGRGEGLGGEIYSVRWGEVPIPERVAAGEEFTIPTRVTNASAAPWIAAGAARVKLAYHWLTAAGETAVYDGERTELPLPVAPGTEVAVDQRIVAPAVPGRYRLVLDLLFEHVAWFADRDGGATYGAEVEVVAAGGGSGEDLGRAGGEGTSSTVAGEPGAVAPGSDKAGAGGETGGGAGGR